jgi:hypothetical protein
MNIAPWKYPPDIQSRQYRPIQEFFGSLLSAFNLSERIFDVDIGISGCLKRQRSDIVVAMGYDKCGKLIHDVYFFIG